MKILTATEMRKADKATTTRLGISSRVLMENAGRAVVSVILREFPQLIEKGVFVFVGSGNNGGDGLVVARVLANLGIKVEVFLVKEPDKYQSAAAEVFQSWMASQGKFTLITENNIDSIKSLLMSQGGLVVDAIFGTGFTGEPSGISTKIISLINAVRIDGDLKVLGVDIPSGVDSSTARVEGVAINCDHTVALAALKIGHICFPGRKYSGDISLAEIGIGQNLEEIRSVKSELLTQQMYAQVIKEQYSVDPELHKGSKGTVVVIGGSSGYYGAAILAGRAALRSGAGLVKLVVPKSVANCLVLSNNELICLGLAEKNGNFDFGVDNQLSLILSDCDAVVIGPGLGLDPGAKSIFESVLEQAQSAKFPLVIDADALNLLAQDSKLMLKVPSNSVLTPHPGEMGRLLGITTKEVQQDRFQAVKKLVEKVNSVVLLKGAASIIQGIEGRIWLNPVADQALATAGSGDVLSGIIGCLLGRKFDPDKAAYLGTFIHGRCVEFLKAELRSTIGVIASDLINMIPQVIESGLSPNDNQYNNHPVVLRQNVT